MVDKNEVRDFLISRRANITPAQAGLPDFGTERRVPGLRREEVAMLADISLDYYIRLERGNIRGASESILESIARALQLNDVERAHLFDLARNAPAPWARPHKSKKGQDPLDGELTALIGELSTRSPQFRRDWAEQDVHEHRTGTKTYRHPEVGELAVSYDVLEMPGEPGISITTYSADEGSPTAEKFALLASWAASEGITTASTGGEPHPAPTD